MAPPVLPQCAGWRSRWMLPESIIQRKRLPGGGSSVLRSPRSHLWRTGSNRNHQSRWTNGRRARRMSFLIAIIIGGIIGWLASMVMKTNAQMGLIANVIVGIVGSVLGHWLAGA